MPKTFIFCNERHVYMNTWLVSQISVNVRSGRVWGHTPEQRDAASTLRRYSFCLRLTIAQAHARLVMPVSIR